MCLCFDAFVDEKQKMPIDQFRQNSLLLESAEDVRLKNMINWLLIPLTRAIDTIVITISDPDSSTAKTLRKLANKNPDYIRYIEEER